MDTWGILNFDKTWAAVGGDTGTVVPQRPPWRTETAFLALGGTRHFRLFAGGCTGTAAVRPHLSVLTVCAATKSPT